MHTCAKCRLRKPREGFHRNRSKPNGLASSCIECRKEYDCEYRKEGRQRELYKEASRKRRSQPYVRAKSIFTTARSHARRSGIEFNIRLERIVNALVEGRCERTGVAFDMGPPKQGCKCNSFAPSIDKINHQGGYTNGNIQIVCWVYNMGKQQMTTDEFEDFIVHAAKFITERREMNNIYPGPMGSHAPIVPVRDNAGVALPISMVHAYIMVSLGYAAARPDVSFRVQRDGWGYPWPEVAPVFAGAPGNVVLPC